MQKVEQWALEHHRSPRSSRLKRMVPSLGSFFTPLRWEQHGDEQVLRRKSGWLGPLQTSTSNAETRARPPTSARLVSSEHLLRDATATSYLSNKPCPPPHPPTHPDPLRLVDAFMEYDEFFALSRRHFIPPNFAELRHILNIAQIHASATSLRLVTFDADGTLYADGAHMQHDNEMIGHVIDLMRAGVHVAIVTAAGYPNEPERFEERFDGLLAALRYQPKAVVNRWVVRGGPLCSLQVGWPGGCSGRIRIADKWE